MPSLFEKRFNDRVKPAAERAFGIDAKTQRGTEVRKVTAYRGDVNPKLKSEDGQSYIELHGVTWSIAVDEYVFAGVETKPLPGDLLKVGNETLVASAMAPGEPCWRYEDASKTRFQIHYLTDNS